MCFEKVSLFVLAVCTEVIASWHMCYCHPTFLPSSFELLQPAIVDAYLDKHWWYEIKTFAGLPCILLLPGIKNTHISFKGIEHVFDSLGWWENGGSDLKESEANYLVSPGKKFFLQMKFLIGPCIHIFSVREASLTLFKALCCYINHLFIIWVWNADKMLTEVA